MVHLGGVHWNTFKISWNWNCEIDSNVQLEQIFWKMKNIFYGNSTCSEIFTGKFNDFSDFGFASGVEWLDDFGIKISVSYANNIRKYFNFETFSSKNYRKVKNTCLVWWLSNTFKIVIFSKFTLSGCHLTSVQNVVDLADVLSLLMALVFDMRKNS